VNKRTVKVTDLTVEQRSLLESRLRRRLTDTQASSGKPAPACPPASPPVNEDDENLVIAESGKSVDEILGKFYGRFPWPWQPMKFSRLTDEKLETVMLSQDLGLWNQQLFPERPRIWVAGCGTNQALEVAMKFPQATVIGSDLSTKSLDLCARNGGMMNVNNLELRRESINQTNYHEQFDLVVCTGVIHHNADPRETLQKLAGALKPSGVMELMVYNRFHRTLTSAFQKAIRIFGEAGEGRDELDFEADIAFAKKIVANFPADNQLAAFLKQNLDGPESNFADLFIQPVEHSYTVQSLDELAGSCGLQMMLPCTTLYVRHLSPSYFWNMAFDDSQVQEMYERLPDLKRWQITNLLMHEQSPDLWFYFQRSDCERLRKSERQICEEFLESNFDKVRTEQMSYIRDSDGVYRLSPEIAAYPLAPPNATLRRILEVVNPNLTMREVFRRMGLSNTFTTVNQARINLTTSSSPYLKMI
jgi:SAM-dependent methyltransferase